MAGLGFIKSNISKLTSQGSNDNKNELTTSVDSGDESSDSNIQLDENSAPIERDNPLGYHLTYTSLAYLCISGVIGTGIFGTPSSVLNSLGSVGASYVLWISGFLIACLKLLVYMEYISYFPNRAGGDVAYLEQAFPKPAFMVPSSYAAVTVVLAFMTSSAVAFGEYILEAAQIDVTTWRERGVAAAALTFSCVIVSLSTKWSLRISNWLGHAKIITLLFISITGLVVLGGHTSVKDPKENFKNAWVGTTTDAQSIANAILKVSFSYGGLGYSVALVNELPVQKRRTGFQRLLPLTFFVIFVLYILTITAYFAGAGSLQDIKGTGVLVASAFFQNVFETTAATRALDVLVALSALGHLITAVVGHSRALRECGRQGVLPFRDFWVSAKPLGTPLGPIAITWIVNMIVMLAPPAGDAYNFVVDLGSYATYIFDFQLSLGLILLRRQRSKAGIPRSKGFRIPLPLLLLQQLYQIFVLIMPLVPPKDTNGNITLIGSDVSFFYATYCVVAFGLLAICYLYYIMWQFVLPYIGKYRHRVERYQLENGELGNRVIKVPVDELFEWDRAHGKTLTLNGTDDCHSAVVELTKSLHEVKSTELD